MYEIETKILEIDVETIKNKLESLGAREILNTRLFVDWFKKKEDPVDNLPWFLRIRTDKEGNSEITWKGPRQHLGVASTKKEINLPILDLQNTVDLFLALGLEFYGHQEKDRISWIYKDWRFDLDQYPGMPAYLEIEGSGEKNISEAIKLLNLEKNIATPKGERDVITENYGLNWFDMRF